MPLGVTASRYSDTLAHGGERVALLGRAGNHLAHGAGYWSCAQDIAIVLRTIRTVLKRKGAY
jgi:hypothetical protein